MTLRVAKTQVDAEEPVLVNPPDEEEILILQLRRAKANKAQAELAIAELEAELIKRAEARGLKTIVRGGLQATVVRRETTKVDEVTLKGVLGEARYRDVCKLVFDKRKLESAISLGTVSLDEVAEASHIVPAKPYVRVSEVVDDEDA